MTSEAFSFLSAYGSTLTARSLGSRAAIDRRQARLWRRLRGRLHRFPAYSGLDVRRLEDLPVCDIAQLRARFSDYNALGLSHAQTLAAAHAFESGHGGLTGGLSAGLSTGTSQSRRGLFVTTPAERATYIGLALAKLMTPTQIWSTRRIALCLRADNPLYATRRISSRLSLRYFPHLPDNSDTLKAIGEFAPQVLIAPSQGLLDMARLRPPMPPLQRLFYGAETLNAIERDFVADRLGVRPDPLYQATEGFLGAPCPLGVLHLNEDFLVVEQEPADSEGRFRPIVTDLLRQSQAIIRVRLDDVLQSTTCACGSPLRAVLPVEGRAQDVWSWPDRRVFPSEVESLISPRLVADHRWVATGRPDHIEFSCEHDADAALITDALRVFDRAICRKPWNPGADYPKRRHVRWEP